MIGGREDPPPTEVLDRQFGQPSDRGQGLFEMEIGVEGLGRRIGTSGGSSVSRRTERSTKGRLSPRATKTNRLTVEVSVCVGNP